MESFRFYGWHLFLFLFILCKYLLGQEKGMDPWYWFSSDNKESLIKNSNLPTQWLNRFGNNVHLDYSNGYIESFLVDPITNGFITLQNISGHFYVRDKAMAFFSD